MAGIAVAALEDETQLLTTHMSGSQVGWNGSSLELELRNRLPQRNLVTVRPHVLVDRCERPSGPGKVAVHPTAIAEIAGMRVLVESGILVNFGEGVPVSLKPDGNLRYVRAIVDDRLIASLVARRLEADLLLMLIDERTPPAMVNDVRSPLTPTQARCGCSGSSSFWYAVETGRRFVEITGRRAAVGYFKDAVGLVRGESGVQIGIGRV